MIFTSVFVTGEERYRVEYIRHSDDSGIKEVQ